MAKLIRDKKTGDYYTKNKQYMIEKGTIGWNVCEKNEYLSSITGIDCYRYSFSCDTLKEVRESL